MTFNEAIEKIMPLVEDGDKSTPFVISRQNGEWVINYPYPADITQKFLEDIKKTDPFAITLTGEDLAKGSFPYCYDKIFIERLRAEYDNAVFTNTDLGELGSLMNLVEENFGEFPHEVTDYLAKFDRPLAALYDMNTISLISDNPDYDYDFDKIGDFVDAIEAHVNDILHNRKKQKIPQEFEGKETEQNVKSDKRNIEGYEEKFSLQLMGHYVVFAENPAADKPYLVCNIRNDNPQGIEESYNSFKTNNYVKAIREYAHHIDFIAQMLETEQFMSGLPFQTLTAADCLQNGENANWENKLIILKADILAPEYKSAEHQLFLCTGGLGAKAEAYGRAVYAKNLYDGKESRYNRHQIEGIANLEKIPDWALKKLSLSNEIKETPGVFTFGGYHFTPYRQYGKGEIMQDKTITNNTERRMSSDFELGMSKYNWKKNGIDYSYDKFYAASGNSEADIFKCIENGKLYVPAENELFQYNEPPAKTKEITKKPVTLDEKLKNAREKVKEADAQKTEQNDKPKKRGERE